MVSQVYSQDNKFYSLNICCLLYVNYTAIKLGFLNLFLKDVGQLTKSLGELEDQARGFATKNNPQIMLQSGSCRDTRTITSVYMATPGR